jgi:aspartokinase-like uncharacterized kinase
MSLVVYKLGGSLLTLPDLAERLRRVLDSPSERVLLVVGGGETADVVRRWDEQFRIGEERAHWLALQAMALNELLVQSILPNSRVVCSHDEATVAWETHQIPILCAHDFLAGEERIAGIDSQNEEYLPHTWEVTSDSIAAWVALRFDADRLVLLKSCELAEIPRSDESAGVDLYFSRLAPRLKRIEWVNLRSDVPLSTLWQT